MFGKATYDVAVLSICGFLNVYLCRSWRLLRPFLFGGDSTTLLNIRRFLLLQIYTSITSRSLRFKRTNFRFILRINMYELSIPYDTYTQQEDRIHLSQLSLIFPPRAPTRLFYLYIALPLGHTLIIRTSTTLAYFIIGASTFRNA